MGTLGELKARIASDLTRDDLTTQIAYAVGDAIAFHDQSSFWFNTSRNLTFNTVAGQTAYGTADYSRIPNLVRIDAMFLAESGMSPTPLDRYEAVEFETVWGSNVSSGRPCGFTYVDQEIRLAPKPDAVYPIRIIGHYKLGAPASDGDSNAWTDDAEELIRTHAKLLLFMDVLGDDEGATRMQSKMPILLDTLRAQTSKRSVTGTIQASDF